MSVRWGKAGAGILFFCQGQCLLTLRSTIVEEPLTWGVPGGSVSWEQYVDPSEEHSVSLNIDTYFSGALKEVTEELGSIPENLKVFDEVIYREGSFTYVTFLVSIPLKDNWNIVLDRENLDAKWFPVDALPPDLHFGVKYIMEQRPGLLEQIFSSENKILVDNPAKVYHGTSLDNLQKIIKYGGMSPGRGYSPHTTKTRNALFYSSEFEAALFYSVQPRVVLEVYSGHLTLHPDWDDASTLISIDLDELQKEFGRIQLGDEISDDLAEDIVVFLDYSDVERAEPATLEVVSINDKNFLLALPYVCLPVNEDAKHIRPELYDDFSWNDGNPCLLSQQFLCYEGLAFSDISLIWIEASAISLLDVPENLILDTSHFYDYSTIINLSGDTELDDDSVDFEPIIMCATDPRRLRRHLNQGQFELWGE
jgi:8-oxo-dGTP pyrophosphatase MutT (NUDIX family)